MARARAKQTYLGKTDHHCAEPGCMKWGAFSFDHSRTFWCMAHSEGKNPYPRDATANDAAPRPDGSAQEGTP